MRNNDVFIFTPKDPSKWSYHCFDGYLIYRDGIYHDTFWGVIPRGNHHWVFNQKELDEVGTVEYYCNLDELDVIREYEKAYYKSEDLKSILEQHNCYPHYFKIKGAKKDQVTVIQNVQAAIDGTKCRLKNLQDRLKELENYLVQASNGNLDVNF